MTYVVSITSQGQISIPAPIRRDFNLNRNKKALVHSEKGRIIIEPVTDLLSLKGSVKVNQIVDLKAARTAYRVYLGKR